MKIKLLIVLLTLLHLQTFCQSNLTPEALQEDAQLLWNALNELHPGLYRHADSVMMRKAYEKLQHELKSNPSPETQFLNFTAFTASIKCGHTYLNPYNQNNKILPEVLSQPVLLPFTFSIFDQKIVVDQSFTEKVPAHSIISSINGVSTASLLDSLSQYVKGDGDRQQKRIKDLEIQMISKYEYFDYLLPLVYRFKDQVTLLLEDGRSIDVNLLTYSERQKKREELDGTKTANHYNDQWSYTFQDQYAYLKLGTFVTWRMTFDWKEYLDAFFDSLEVQHTPHLIVDIRGNEGGLTDVSNYIMDRLANTEGETVFRKPHMAYKKVSDEVRPHVGTWSKWFYNTSLWTKKLNDQHRTIRFSANGPKKISPHKKAYSGKSYLLINEANSSATFILAEVCKKNKYATLIGSETGGSQKGITGGQIFFLTLPNSQLEVDIPLIGRYPLSSLPDSGIQPDITITQSLKAHIEGRDEILLKAIEFTTKQTD